MELQLTFDVATPEGQHKQGQLFRLINTVLAQFDITSLNTNTIHVLQRMGLRPIPQHTDNPRVLRQYDWMGVSGWELCPEMLYESHDRVGQGRKRKTAEIQEIQPDGPRPSKKLKGSGQKKHANHSTSSWVIRC